MNNLRNCARPSLSVLFLALTACASLTHGSRNQYVKIQTDPPGATIVSAGQTLGATPKFVELRRGFSTKLEVVKDSQTYQVPLAKRYNWTGSFWPNFAFLYFAPIGWAVDFLTGAAWKFKDPAPVHIAGRAPTNRLKGEVAIAPPQSDSASLSDETGKALNDILPLRAKRYQFLPYSNTLPTFLSQHYDFDHSPGEESVREHELFSRLGVREIFESEIKETEDSLQVQGTFRDVFTGEKSSPQTVSLPLSEASTESSWYEGIRKWFHIIPNTPSIELAPSDTELQTIDGGLYRAVPADDNSFVGIMTPYLSAISLTHQQAPRREGASEFRFQFVPAFRFAITHVTFPDFTQIQNVDFRYIRASAGLGPEIGWRYHAHYIYFDFIPIYGYYHLAWNNGGDHEDMSTGAITTRSEIGYSYYFNSNWNARLFSKSVGSPTSMWNTAIHQINPSAPDVIDSYDFSLGFSVGYTFDPNSKFRYSPLGHASAP